MRKTQKMRRRGLAAMGTVAHHDGWPRHHQGRPAAPLDFRLGRGVVHQLLLRRREFPGLADRRLSCGPQHIAVPTWRKRFSRFERLSTSAKAKVPSTLTGQMVGFFENDATAAQLITRSTCIRRGVSAGQPGGVEEIAAEDLLRPQCQAVGFVDAMHQQVAAQAFEPLLAGFGADQEGQLAVPGGDQLGGDRTAESRWPPSAGCVRGYR